MNGDRVTSQANPKDSPASRRRLAAAGLRVVRSASHEDRIGWIPRER